VEGDILSISKGVEGGGTKRIAFAGRKGGKKVSRRSSGVRGEKRMTQMYKERGGGGGEPSALKGLHRNLKKGGKGEKGCYPILCLDAGKRKRRNSLAQKGGIGLVT